MKSTGLILGLMTMLTLLAGASSCSHKGPNEKMDWIEGKIVSKLELNKEQEGKLHELVAAVKEQRKAHRGEHKETKNVIKDMILSPKLDHDKLKALFAKKQARMNESFEAVYPKLEAFHASLNADQKKQATEYLEKLSKWHKD